MSISGADLTKLLSGDQIVIPTLNVVPATAIATARINQASFTYPLGQVTVDNTSANWLNILPGMMVWIGTSAGAHDVMVTVARKAPGASTLYIAGTAGDPGIAMREHVALADNQYVTVLYYKPLWSLLSRISESTFYKQFDVAYSDEGSDPDPVSNLGKWRQAWVDPDTGNASLSFPDATAAPSYAQAGKTISSSGYAWEVIDVTGPGSSSVDSGGGSTDTTMDVTFGPGAYIVRRTVTDSGGKTHTAEVWVFINDPDDYPALRGWEMGTVNETREGARTTITLQGEVGEDVLFPGAALLLTESQTYNGSTVTAGTTVDTFVAFVAEDTAIQEIELGRVQAQLDGPADVLKKIAMATQYIEEVTSPTKWTEVTSNLSNPDGVLWYILHHHVPTALQLFDYVPLADVTLRKQTFTFSGKTVWAQLQELAGMFFGNVGFASEGTLYLKHDPNLMSTSDRDALDVHMDWDEDTIRERFEYGTRLHQGIGQVTGWAFAYDGTTVLAFGSLWPGHHQGQGPNKPVLNGVLVPAATGQSRLEAIVGHWAAREDNPTPSITFDVMRNLDLDSPARMRWHTLKVATTLDPMLRGWATNRVTLLAVSRTWRKMGDVWLKEISYTVQPETYGQPGIYIPVPTNEGFDFETPDISLPPFPALPSFEDPGVESWDQLRDGMDVIAAMNTDGYLYQTQSFTRPSGAGGPDWLNRVSLGVTGTPVQMCRDPRSVSTEDFYLATTTNLYLVEDAHNASPTVTPLLTFRDTTSYRSLEASQSAPGSVVCLSAYDDGVYCTYATDGATFATEAIVGAGSPGGFDTSWAFPSDADGWIERPAVAGDYNLRWTGSEGYNAAGAIYDNVYSATLSAETEYISGAQYPYPYTTVMSAQIDLGEDISLNRYVNESDATDGYCIGFRVKVDSDAGHVLYTEGMQITIVMYNSSDTRLLTVSTGRSSGDYFHFAPASTGSWTTRDVGFQDTFYSVDDLGLWNYTVNGVRKVRIIVGWGPYASTPPNIYVDDIRIRSINSGGAADTAPGAVHSPRTAGRVVTTAFDGTNAPADYESTDSGDSFAALSGISIDPGDRLAAEIHAPYQGNQTERMFYHAYYSGSERRLYRVEATTRTDISPTYSSVKYAPWQSRWQLQSFVTNRLRMLCFGMNGAGSLAGAWTSTNGGAAWTNIITPVSDSGARYERGAIAGDNGACLFLWGKQALGYSDDFGAAIDDRLGNIPDDWPSFGTFIGIIGSD